MKRSECMNDSGVCVNFNCRHNAIWGLVQSPGDINIDNMTEQEEDELIDQWLQLPHSCTLDFVDKYPDGQGHWENEFVEQVNMKQNKLRRLLFESTTISNGKKYHYDGLINKIIDNMGLDRGDIASPSRMQLYCTLNYCEI